MQSGLRGFLARMEAQGDLLRVPDEVDPHLEIGAAIRETSDRSGPVLLFERVKGHAMPVVGGVFGSRRLCYEALGCTRETRLRRYLEGISNPLPVREVRDAPSQEIVEIGERVDLGALPVPLYNELDGGPYITVGVLVSRSPANGTLNAGMYRLQVKGPNRMGISMGPQQHIGMHFREAEERGEPLPFAVALGVDPLVAYATQASAPYGVDELTLAGGLLGEPVEVVRCRTVDLLVPADAEIVLEGRILPGAREPEGPFGEYPGYYTDEKPAPRPVLEVTAITRRQDAIFQAGLTGAPMTENHVLKEVPLEAALIEDLQHSLPQVVDVHYPPAGSNGFLSVVAIRSQSSRDGRNVLAAILGSRKRGKYNVVVDDDVDIFDMERVLHAICTRTEPAEDALILPNVSPVALDPAASNGEASAMGIDATRPMGRWFPTAVQTAGWPRLAELLAERPSRPGADPIGSR